MYTFILAIHFICCLLLILLILMQSGKGSAAGIFGGGGGGDNLFASPTAFNMVNRITAAVAVIIFVTSVSLTMIANKRGVSSAADKIKIPPVSAPANPAPSAPAHK